MTKNIIVFYNTTGVAELMRPFFGGEGYRVCTAQKLQEVIEMISRENIHLLLIDMELKESGWDGDVQMIRSLRARTPAPIIVVSPQTAETAKITALNVGADDYVAADDNPLVLLARVKSQLRRYAQLTGSKANADPVYRVGSLEVDDRRHMVSVGGRDVKMTPIEYKILRLLIQGQGKVFSIEQIYESIWQMRAIGADNTIAVHIRHIREKIENNPKKPSYLKVVRGVGYKVG